jgi:citrate synthase/citryl-CoA lyase
MTWKTNLTEINPGEIRIKGYRQRDLMGEVTFADGVYLLFTGTLPSKAESRLFSAVLTACLDHSVTPPSAQATRHTTSGGASLPSAVASGLVAVGDHHGGAMLELQKLVESVVVDSETDAEREDRVEQVVADYREAGENIPGFGHRYHSPDPRAETLTRMLEETGLDGEYAEVAGMIRDRLHEETGVDLPLNVDGAIAVVLAELRIDASIAQAIFVIGRAAGLAAHAHEERTREAPMRDMGPSLDDIEYDGPGPRELPDRGE